MSDTIETRPETLSEGEAVQVEPHAIIEAILMSSDDPLSPSRIAQILGIGTASDVDGYVASLNDRYEKEGASFRIEKIAKGFQILTNPLYDPWIRKLHKSRTDSRLSPAALETLAIVAYKQPVLRAEVEAVRGVACGEMLTRLRDVNLVRIVGRADEIGRPLLYGTTTRFLEVFGLASLKDLPKLDDEKTDSIPQLKAVPEEDCADDGENQQVETTPDLLDTHAEAAEPD